LQKEGGEEERIRSEEAREGRGDASVNQGKRKGKGDESLGCDLGDVFNIEDIWGKGKGKRCT